MRVGCDSWKVYAHIRVVTSQTFGTSFDTFKCNEDIEPGVMTLSSWLTYLLWPQVMQLPVYNTFVKIWKLGLVWRHINLCRSFNAKAILPEEQQWYYLTHSWEDKGVHTFPRGICPKVNLIVLMEFELAYYNSTVHRFKYYTMKTPPPLEARKMCSTLTCGIKYKSAYFFLAYCRNNIVDIEKLIYYKNPKWMVWFICLTVYESFNAKIWFICKYDYNHKYIFNVPLHFF